MLSPSEIVVSRAGQAERKAAIASAEPTPSTMAERFAPESQKNPEGPPRPQATQAAISGLIAEQARVPSANRWLLIASLLVSLVPTALILALIWQGAIKLPQPAGVPNVPDQDQFAENRQASLAPVPVIAPRSAVEIDVKPADIALTTPAKIAGKTGEEVNFDIAIDSADALPARSMIAIRDLPRGASFSQGRRYTDTEWNLRPDEIGDLALRLPETASGTSELRIELMAADGTALASATTKLEVVPDPKSALILRSDESGRIADLIKHGEKMIEVGYLAGARAYFKRAVEAGSGEAALKLGATYDPEFIHEIGALGVKADPKEARVWYERAKELGVEGAELKLKALKENWTGHEAPGQATELDVPGPDLAKVETGSNTATNAARGAPIPTGKEEWVSLVSYVNVRAAPSTTADTIRVAEKGAKFRATGRDGNWVQITDPTTSEVGWVYSRFIETAEAPAR